jgi:hypothetical protein
MAAMLEKNGPDGRPITLPDDLPQSEPIKCTAFEDCLISYTLAYGKVEALRQDSEIESMRSTASALVASKHPHPRGKDERFWWEGPEHGWLEEKAAKHAGV